MTATEALDRLREITRIINLGDSGDSHDTDLFFDMVRAFEVLDQKMYKLDMPDQWKLGAA